GLGDGGTNNGSDGPDISSMVPGLAQAGAVNAVASQSIAKISSDLASLSGLFQQGAQFQLQGELQRAIATYGSEGDPNPQYVSLFTQFNNVADKVATVSPAPEGAKYG